MSLKERIAALQEREQRDRDRATSPTPPTTNTNHAHGPAPAALRAKIAQFESKGGVPVPRGSFGLGAPPESAPKRRAELYGNRMQPARIPSAALARPTSPFADLEPDDQAFRRARDRDQSHNRALSPQPGNGHPPSPPKAKPTVQARGTAFSTALDIARKAEADVKRERRTSALWLQPQFTGGGALTPQHTGGSQALTQQFTGGSSYAGSLLPQHTGGSMSPLAPYSPAPSSPSLLSPASPALFSPTSPPLLSPTTPSMLSPRAFPGAEEEESFVEEPEQAEDLVADAERPMPVPEEDPLAFADDPAAGGDVDDAEPTPIPIPLPTADPTPTPTHAPELTAPQATEQAADAAEREEQVGEEQEGEGDGEGEAASARLDEAADEDERAAFDPYAENAPSPSPSRSSFGNDDPSAHVDSNYNEYDDLHDEDEVLEEDLAPLPNSLASHAFRAHLSTITERSADAGEPGSPGWDRRFSVASASGPSSSSRFSGASVPEEQEDGEGREEDEPRAIPVARTGTGADSPSPYRMSGYTERGYTPSLRSDGVSVRSSFDADAGGDDANEDGADGEDGEEEEGEEEGTRGHGEDGEGRDKEGGEGGDGEGEEMPPTPMADPRTPTGLALGAGAGAGELLDGQESFLAAHDPARDSLASLAPSPRDSLLSTRTRDSLASLSPSQRDSLRSTHTRDSLSSAGTGAQTLFSRPLSTLTADSGSPSHVALAHRVPVVLGASGVGRGVALFVPGSAGAEAAFEPQEEEHTPEPTPTVAPAPAARRRPLPTAPAAPSTPPRRHAYTTGAPRPYTAYLPPADDDDDGEAGDGIGEFGTIAFGGGAGAARSFSAVVHGRVREEWGRRPGEDKWGRAGAGEDGDGHDGWRDEHAHGDGWADRDKRLPLPPTPLSPGYASGELAELLAEAAALERRLERGELPGEAARRMSVRPAPGSALPPAQPPPPVPAVPVQAQGQALRPKQPSFRNPLARSRSDRHPRQQRDEGRPSASSSMGNLLAMQGAVGAPLGPGPSSAAPATPELPPLVRSKSSTTLAVADSRASDDVPPTPPPKSPGFAGGQRYFSSLRRLASTSRALGGPRGSVSTSSELSSEDSMGLATPPDEVVQHGAPAPGPAAAGAGTGSGAGIAWPSLASKKSVGSIGRGAATLAGKMWHRTRSKSSSTVSSLEAPSPPPPMPVPSMPSPPMLKLEQTPFFVPPIQTDLYGRNAPYSPNSTPIADPVINISPPSEPTPVARTKPAPPRPPHLTLGTSASATAPQLPVPKTAPESRPASWVSVSSGGSESLAASPLFDKAIFDAFPSVPEMPSPQQQQSAHLRMRSGSYARAHSLHSTGTNSPAESMPPSNSMPAFAPEPLMGRLYVAAEAQRRVNPLP